MIDDNDRTQSDEDDFQAHPLKKVIDNNFLLHKLGIFHHMLLHNQYPQGLIKKYDYDFRKITKGNQ